MAGAPKGNTNAKGNKGGGRKSAYQELADALDAHSIFFNENDQEALEAKIRSAKYSLMDRLILTAWRVIPRFSLRLCTRPYLI
jgi:uncharacterized protein YjcR